MENYKAEAKNLLATMPETDIVIYDPQSFEIAVERLRQIATVKKGIQEKFAEPKKRAHEAHKAITALEKEMLDFVSRGESILRMKTVAYREAEQKRIEAEQERKRIEAEKQMLIAEQAEADGDTEKAEIAVALAAMETASVTIAPKATGMSFREVWSAEVVDLDKIPREYLIPDMNALNALAKATKGSIKIPGVKFNKQTVSSVRAK